MYNAAPDIRPVIWGVGKFQIAKSFHELAPEFSGRLKFDVITALSDEAVDIVTDRLRNEHCDALISAGSNAAYLRKRLPVPVVSIRIGGFDILDAMVKAARGSDKIAVVLHFTQSKDLRTFGEVFSLNVAFRYYYTLQDLREVMEELRTLGIKAVVGAGAAVAMAESMGISGFSVYTLDSIRLAVEDALSLVAAKLTERSRYILLNTVLYNLGDGVLAVDNQGRLMAANPAAERIARCDLAGRLGNSLQELIPDLRLAADARTTKAQIGAVEDIGGRTLVVDRSPLFEANTHIGTLITLHSPGYVENASSRLRAHGFVRSRSARYALSDIMAESASMRSTIRRCRVFAEHSNATVLLTGPSGVGKELLAQGIHNAGARSGNPFIAVNCGAFPENLLESELFGYEEGAFTGARQSGKRGLFEAADKGTIFFDEIAELPLLLQTRLLRVLQEREVVRVGGHDAIPVDVRIIAATHADLVERVEQGQFREDLFYRISVLKAAVPPLRDRPEDLKLLTRIFFTKTMERVGLGGMLECLLSNLEPVFQRHPWPGNVRELENMAERCAMACLEKGKPLTAPQVEALLDLPGDFQENTGDLDASLAFTRSEVEKDRLLEALRQCSGSRERAAGALGISRTTLWRLMKRHGLRSG